MTSSSSSSSQICFLSSFNSKKHWTNKTGQDRRDWKVSKNESEMMQIKSSHFETCLVGNNNVALIQLQSHSLNIEAVYLLIGAFTFCYHFNVFTFLTFGSLSWISLQQVALSAPSSTSTLFSVTSPKTFLAGKYCSQSFHFRCFTPLMEHFDLIKLLPSHL